MAQNKKYGIKFPTDDNIGARTSTIAKSLATSIIPRVEPTENEYKDYIALLHECGWIDKETPSEITDYKCAYCGNIANQFDHLYPLIKNKKPTGYITEVNNLVPCCSNCNSQKGNTYWNDFCPNNEPLKRFVRNTERKLFVTSLPQIETYWKHYDELCSALSSAQKESDDFLMEYEIVKSMKRNGEDVYFEYYKNKRSNEINIVIKSFIDQIKGDKNQVINYFMDTQDTNYCLNSYEWNLRNASILINNWRTIKRIDNKRPKEEEKLDVINDFIVMFPSHPNREAIKRLLNNESMEIKEKYDYFKTLIKFNISFYVKCT